MSHIIESERLTLAPLAYENVEGPYLDWMNDPDVKLYLEARFQSYTAADLWTYVSQMNENPKIYMFGIFIKPSGRHIGNIKLGPIDPHHLRGDIGLFIGDSEVRGQGYDSEAIIALTRFAFDELGVHKVAAGSYANNMDSIDALKKAGFSHEGTLPGHVRFGDRWVDALYFANYAMSHDAGPPTPRPASAMNSVSRIIFRADASASIGAGHVSRCSVLADALAAVGWDCAFAATRETADFIQSQGRGGGDFLVLDGDPAGEIEAMKARWPEGCEVLVVDHYGRDADYETACRPWARAILTIDDLAERPHGGDILLNQNLGQTSTDYDRLINQPCRVLVGPEYALLRPQFATARPAALERRKSRHKVERVLVSLGSTDPDNVTCRVIDTLSELGLDVAVDVVLGARAPHLLDVQERLDAKLPSATLHTEVADMAGLMAAADLAIGAAGSSSWERCCLGLPTLILITADNQRDVAQELTRRGAAVLVGLGDETGLETLTTGLQALSSDFARLREMSHIAAGLCDGRGVERVMPMLVGPMRAKDGSDILLRCAEHGDEATVLAWQRHPVTRRYSRNLKPPLPVDHHDWFDAHLENPGSRMMIILCDGKPVGVLRLDTQDDLGAEPVFEISILIDSKSQGHGIGLAALRLVRSLVPGVTLLANIFSENIASRRLFEAAGYQPSGDGVCYLSKRTDAPLMTLTEDKIQSIREF